jgi:17beta-estradiol 17-dehydrogenase / very-long-chain 3-oxoacyl-CoA reductase
MDVPYISSVATATGYLTLTWLLYHITCFITFHFWAPRNALSRYRREVAPISAHALITGSSQGIGFGLASELVKRGFGVILLAHIQEELDAAKARLEKLAATASLVPDIRLLCINAVTVTESELEEALSSIQDLPITILVNNVGGMPVDHPPFRFIWEYNAYEINNTISLNARFMAQVTRIMMPTLVRNGPSLVLNLSSGAQVGMPWLTMYSATKAFNAVFSKALARETRAAGLPVDSIAILPGEVLTEGNCLAVPKGSPNAAEFAKMILDRVDIAVARRALEIFPYWVHELQFGFLNMVPERLKQTLSVIGIKEKREGFNKRK